MSPFFDPVRQNLAAKLSELISEHYSLSLEPRDCFSAISTPPDTSFGQLCFPCFPLAKSLKKSPKDIAQELAHNWQVSDIKAQAMGPYLNFQISMSILGEQVAQIMISGSYFQNPQRDNQPYLIEYSQPNTHKELHVGHMRNLCFGHSLILLFRYCGHPVVSCTFPGDVGTHVAKCLWYLKYHHQGQWPEAGRGEWLGRMYSLAHNKLEDEKGSDKEAQNREQLSAILKQIEQKSGEFFDLWKETREWSIALMSDVYKWAGVTFDKWYWESEVDSASVELVRKLHSQGLLVEDQGALGLHLEDGKLGFCMLLKSDGNGLYSTKDLELARRKFAEYNPIENIVVVDMRQELHFKQVFSAFEQLGLGDKNRCRHLKYNFVELPEGAMSSRKGNIIPITQLIEKMRSHVESEYLERYRGNWSDQEISQVADQVAQGAIKYGMNRMDPNKKIVFDMKEWLRLDGESGPYIQYTQARIQSLVTKLGESSQGSVDWSLLIHEREVELLSFLNLFNSSMAKSLENYKTSGVCNYLYDLAKLFNSFYHDCPIGKLEDKNLQATRLALCKASQQALKQGLSLLGIPAPQRM